jgi:hypothetical protein
MTRAVEVTPVNVRVWSPGPCGKVEEPAKNIHSRYAFTPEVAEVPGGEAVARCWAHEGERV